MRRSPVPAMLLATAAVLASGTASAVERRRGRAGTLVTFNGKN